MVTAVQGYLNNSGMGGLPDLLTGGLADQPNYTPTYLDPYTNQVIAGEAAEGGQTQEQIINNELYGTNANAPNSTGGAVAQQQASLGGQPDPNVTSALNNRAGRLYDSQYNQLKAQATANAPAIQGQLMNQGTQALQKQQDVGNQINDTQMQVIANQNALRNQVISQLFGAGGQFAGTMAAAQTGGAGLNAGTQGQMIGMNNDPNFRPQVPALDAGMQGQAPNLGVNYGMDGNGYYGEPPVAEGQSLLDTGGQPGYGINTNGMGYGLGYSYNGRG